MPADAKIAGVINRGLGSQRASFFVILLDPRVLVINVQRRDHAVGDHARTKPARRLLARVGVKEELYLAGPAGVEILLNDFLEKHTTGHWPVEHLRQRKFRLQDGHLIPVAGTAISGCEGMRELA